MNQKQLQEKIFGLKDEKYREFHQSLCPGVNNIIGVRVPVLRKFAKEIYQTENWKEILEIKPLYYEEKMLQGMLIGFNKKESIKNVQKQIESFIPKIDNWAVCDTFCAGLKITNKNKEEMWLFLQKYLNSDKEFEIRFGIVMLLDYYIEEKYLHEIFKISNKTKNEAYYVKMAVAWLISICYIKYPKETLEYLNKCELDNWTYNKAIQKAIESYRVTKEDKQILRNMKIK